MHTSRWLGWGLAGWILSQVTPAWAGPVQTTIDPRVELASVMADLTPWSRQSAPPPSSAYAQETLSSFSKHEQHPAIVQLQDWLSTRKLSLGTWIDIALHLSPDCTPPADVDGSWKARMGADTPVQEALDALATFASDARVTEFFTARHQTHEVWTGRLTLATDRAGTATRLERYLGQVPGHLEVVLAPLLPKENAQSVALVTSTEQGPRVVVRALSVARDKSPDFLEETSSFQRQVCRGWLRSLMGNLLSTQETALASSRDLLTPIQEDMRTRGLMNWSDTVAEHLARAIDTRLVQESGDARAATTALRSQERTGFAYIREFFNLLSAYEGDRTTYPDLNAFLPAVLEKLTYLQETGAEQEVARRLEFFQGPLDRAREPRFVAKWAIVEPQMKDTALQKKVHTELVALTETMTQRTGAEIQILDADAAKAQDLKETALIVVGTPWSNRFMQALLQYLPIKVSKGNLQLGAKQFLGDGLRLAATFSNPYNARLPMTILTASEDAGIPGLIDQAVGANDFVVLKGPTTVMQGDLQYDSRGRWTLR